MTRSRVSLTSIDFLLTLYTLINPRTGWLAAKQLETWRFLGDPFEGDPFAKAAIIPCLHKAFKNYHETVNMHRLSHPKKLQLLTKLSEGPEKVP